ncbi:ABC transporter ATP-binding protein, partial [Streptomyces scabiei]
MTIMIPRAAVSADRIGEVLESSDALTRPEDPVSEFPTPGTVEFDDVTFSYPGADAAVLQGISFRAEPGETVAIVGS